MQGLTKGFGGGNVQMNVMISRGQGHVNRGESKRKVRNLMLMPDQTSNGNSDTPREKVNQDIDMMQTEFKDDYDVINVFRISECKKSIAKQNKLWE